MVSQTKKNRKMFVGMTGHLIYSNDIFVFNLDLQKT